MFTSLLKKKNPHMSSCLVCHALVAVLLFLAFIGSFMGTLMAHYDVRNHSMIFGTMGGSLALIAFVYCTTSWMKSMKACMDKCEMCGTNGKK